MIVKITFSKVTLVAWGRYTSVMSSFVGVVGHFQYCTPDSVYASPTKLQ